MPSIAAPMMAGQAAAGQAAESVSSMRDLGESVRELVILPLATSGPVQFSPVPVALGSSPSQKLRSIAVNSAVLDAAAQLDAHKTAESSDYAEQGLASTVNVSSSMATAASSTLGVPPVVRALPKVQSSAGVSATDSAVLWMAEQWETGKAIEIGLGSVAHKHQSNLMGDVTTSASSDADDWMLEVATSKGQ